MGNNSALQKNSKNAVVSFLWENPIVVALVILCAAISILSPYFLKSGNLINVLRQISVNGLLSIGMTFIILTGGIDLSCGSLLAFGGITAASLVSSVFMKSGVLSTPAAVAVGLFAGFALGSISGLIVSKLKMPPFIVTLGMLSIARGATYIYSDGMPIPQLEKSYLAIGQGSVWVFPMPVVIFAVAFLLCWLLLHRMKYGRYVYAVGGNVKSARISGVNVDWIIYSVYAMAGFFYALGGIILSARTSAGLPQAGLSYELDAIAAVVIGGTSLSGGRGSLTGTLMGVLMIGVINNGLDLLGVSSYYQQVIKGLIIIGAVLLDYFRKER